MIRQLTLKTVAWLRMTHKPLLLPTGHTIEPDTLIAVCDPRFNSNLTTIPDPNTFRVDRYIIGKATGQKPSAAPLSSTGTTDNNSTFEPALNNAFSSTSPDDLTFGYGVHACPGRFFATAELKLILVELLTKYDFRFEEGVVGRPENQFLDFMILPPAVKVLFRRRAVHEGKGMEER
jgi:cytochrome P450